MRLLIFLLLISLVSSNLYGKSNHTAKKRSPKTQEINFDEMTLQGQIRNPHGAYLVQKNGIQFMPLYDIQKDVDDKIRRSGEWMR